MSNLAAETPLSPIERARLSAELLSVRASLSAKTLNPIEQVRASTRGLELRALLGPTVQEGEQPLMSEAQVAFEKAREFYRSKLQGQVVQTTIGPVLISGKGWNKTKFGLKDDALKARLIESIVEILTSGSAGQRTEPYKARPDGVVAFYFIQKEVQVDNLMVLAGVQVSEDSQGNKFYNISHSGAKGWTAREGAESEAKKSDTTGSAWIKPRSDDAAHGVLDSIRVKPNLHLDTAEETVADDDLNITILSVVPVPVPGATPAPANSTTNTLVTELQPQKNGSVLVVGDAQALDAYARAYLDQAKYTVAPTGLLLTKSQARLAQYLPRTQEVLPTGAVIYSYADDGVSVGMGRELSGIARNLAELKSLIAQGWGGEKFRAVFGEDAAPADVAIYQQDQDEIANRKLANVQAEVDKADAVQADIARQAEQARVDAVELERALAEQDRQKREGFESSIAIGKSKNSIYQAYLDTLEQLPKFGDGDHEFLGWGAKRASEFRALIRAPISSDPKGHTAYVREWADKHLSERVKATLNQSSLEVAAIEPQTEQHSIIEYTTKRDKVLRGIIRTDLTLAEAKAIDKYTWRMNGGYFIREKHLEGETGHIPAATAPVVLSAEQQAEQQATAERQVEERRQEALASQVQKLRTVADKAVTSGDAGMNADRKTNTARRAGMAASAIDKAAVDKAAGQTLNNIADAIEVGAAGMLAKLSSRAQLDQLRRVMRMAQAETDKGLTYTEQLSRRGRPFSDDDIKHLTFPRPMAWSNRYKSAALNMAKKAPKGNSRLIAALTKIGAGPERFHLDDDKAAITRKASSVLKGVGEGWDLVEPVDALARADRLARMGVTDTVTLQEAVRELLPHLAEKAEEDPIKKAERAIIGQKVGIDFFPTPAHLAQRMARLAGITKDTRVLEPSAGNGNLADAAKADGGVVDVIEISSQLRDILTAKGYTVVATDFDNFTPDTPYRAIVMNPPFSKRQDAAHIMRAYTMLAGGGRLVAIAGEGVFFGRDQKATAFREWLDAHGATVETLEGGTFKDNTLLAQTGVNARLIILKK